MTFLLPTRTVSDILDRGYCEDHLITLLFCFLVHSRDRTYYLRWGLLTVGIAGWAIAATLLDAQLWQNESARPPRPIPTVVVPTNPTLEGPSVDLSATLNGTLDFPQRKLPTDSATRLDDALWSALDGVGRPTESPVLSTTDRPAPSGTQAAETSASIGFPTTYADQLRLYRTLQRKPGANTALELGGFVVDETITPQGRIFYDSFYGVWQSPPVEGFYTVKIQEKPTPGRGTLVQVFVNDDTTYRTRLQRQSDIDERALQAARRTYAYVRSGEGILQIQ